MNIAISAGHYPEKPGTQHNGLSEHEEAYKIALCMEAELIQSGHQFNLIPPEHLDSKVRNVNVLKCDLAVEVHLNAAPTHLTGQITGFEILHYPGSQDGKALGQFLINNMRLVLPFRDRGNKGLDGYQKFRWLNGCVCPSVIVEVLFLDNELDSQYLRMGKSHEVVGRCLVQGIIDYCKWISDDPHERE